MCIPTKQMETILLTVGSPRTDREMMSIIRRNLPEEYSNFIRTVHLVGIQSREDFEEKLIVHTEFIEGTRKSQTHRHNKGMPGAQNATTARGWDTLQGNASSHSSIQRK